MDRTTGQQARPSKADVTPAQGEMPQHLSSDDDELDRLDAESADSFPASDPPSTSIPTTLGAEKQGGEQDRR